MPIELVFFRGLVFATDRLALYRLRKGDWRPAIVDPRPREALGYVEKPFDGTLIAAVMSALTVG